MKVCTVLAGIVVAILPTVASTTLTSAASSILQNHIISKFKINKHIYRIINSYLYLVTSCEQSIPALSKLKELSGLKLTSVVNNMFRPTIVDILQ